MSKGYHAKPGEKPTENCNDCPFHKRMGSGYRGVKVEGETGKCVRAKGPCKGVPEPPTPEPEQTPAPKPKPKAAAPDWNAWAAIRANARKGQIKNWTMMLPSSTSL
jgi:hypothetical protein